jgi:hypothetical protein
MSAQHKDFVVKNGIIINNTITLAGRTHSRILDSSDVTALAPTGDGGIAMAIALG